MSGISGIFRRDELSLEPAELQFTVERMAHRGPDGIHTWINGPIGLGHCMLWTTPESLLEKLPAHNARGGLVITADARIDNRDELIELLGWQGRSKEKITDSELILGAYETWREDCITRLIGDFAFAIWDQTQQTLFCARDHMGVKPFYYSQSPTRFAFASEIKGLLDLPGVTRKIDPLRMGDFLLLEMQDKVSTTYKDVVRLPPAHTLKVTAKTLEINQYWKLDPTYELQLDSDEAYAQEFRRIFTEAVRCRLRSAFPIGSHLSGGMDSSSVTCVARDLLKQSQQPPLHTLSNIFDEVTECDERPYINTVLEQGHIIPHFIHADQFGPLTDLEEVRKYEDEALLGPSHHYPWRLSKKAQEIGLRVVLDGLDGDNVVCHGILRLRELAQNGDWQLFTEEVQAVAKSYQHSNRSLFKRYGLSSFQAKFSFQKADNVLRTAKVLHQALDFSYKELLWHWGLKHFLEKIIKKTKTNISKKSTNTDKKHADQLTILNPIFLENEGLRSRLHRKDKDPFSAATVREFHHHSLVQGIIPYILEQFDRTAATAQIEERHPFMDKRLIEFCLALPSDQKLRSGWGRYVLRKSLNKILPEEVCWRGNKTSMAPNFYHGLTKIDRQILERVATQDLQSIEPFVTLESFHQAYSKVLKKQARQHEVMQVWKVLILANWLSNR